MRRPIRFAIGMATLALLFASGCAYFNTLYNAKQKYREGLDLKAKADPEREEITQQEKRLYKESFEKAARVVKYYSDSKWVDDALLLMAKASHEKGDYSTALRKYDEILTFYPRSNLVPETLVMQGRTLIETKEYDRAVAALSKARDQDKKEFRGDVIFFLGTVEENLGHPEEAVAAYSQVVEKHRGSVWFGEAGMRAGDLRQEAGDLVGAVAFYEKVRSKGHTPLEQYRGGMKKGEALLELQEWKRAYTTFRDVGDRTVNEDDRGDAYLQAAHAVSASGDTQRAHSLYLKLIEDFPRRSAAAEAQFAIGKALDDAGDLEAAMVEYDLVREQGTGHPAWQRSSQRQAEIQRVLDLRAEIAAEDEADRERKRFLLAEQLLEKIGDVDGALAEYASLAEDAAGTEWGYRATFARAWVLENRLAETDSASALLFELANRDTRTEVGAAARRRNGMAVWKFEELDIPRVVFIRGEGDEDLDEIVVSRVEPREVPLPPGTREVRVWVRIHVARDGSVENAKIVKSGGEEFDDAVREAANASRFVAPADGGPEITVVEYLFPPPVQHDANELVQDDEPSAGDRDAMLDAQDAAAAQDAADAEAVNPFSAPPTEDVPLETAPIDSAAIRFDRRGDER